jgi:hypothetical protein
VKPLRRIAAAGGMLLSVLFTAGSCNPWNPLAGAGIGDLKLFWLSGYQLFSSDLDGASVDELYFDGSAPSYAGIAVDPVNKKVYWSDTMGFRIYRANLDGSSKETVASIGAAAMAIDPANEKIYYVSGMVEINRMNLDGTGIENLWTTGGTITDVKLDPVDEQIYWNDGSTLYRSPLSNPLAPQTVATNALTLARIALDVVGGVVYFSESAGSELRKVSMGGGIPTTVYNVGGSNPAGLDVDPYQGRLYWSEPAAGTGMFIYSVGMDGGDFRSVVDQPGTGDAYRLVLFLWP